MKAASMTLRKTALAAIGAAVLALGAAGGVIAQTPADKATVDAAKAQGVVGEQADGYLGIVSGGDAATAAAVAHINGGRAKAYADIAARTGVTVAQAGEATAQQLIAKLPPGAYYRAAGGGWVRK
jgi:uncharacterized protein YdbL (DUF1318 family)